MSGNGYGRHWFCVFRRATPFGGPLRGVTLGDMGELVGRGSREPRGETPWRARATGRRAWGEADRRMGEPQLRERALRFGADRICLSRLAPGAAPVRGDEHASRSATINRSLGYSDLQPS